jgi:phosphatidylinositol glycan class B
LASVQASTAPAFSSQLAARIIFVAVMIAGAGARLWLAFHDDGIVWADEIYQSLEPAHRAVFGYGRVAWEFQDGARSWVYPGAIAGVLKLCAWLQLEPRQYLAVLRVLLVAISVGTGAGVYRLSRRLSASPLSAAAGTALFMLAEPMIYFGHRALSETACALPAIWGLACALPRARERRGDLQGAALLALAALIRPHAALFGTALLGTYAVRGEWRSLLRASAVLAFGIFLSGLIDRLTWGGWFHSTITYLTFNVIENKAAQWGIFPGYFYARVLVSSMPGIAWLTGALALPGVLRTPALAATGALFFLVHSAVGHKEYRFMLPAIPVFCALAAQGIDVLAEQASHRRPWLVGVALLLAAASALSLGKLDMGQLAMDDGSLGKTAYDRFGGVNRLLLLAHDQADLCGLHVPDVPWWNIGGYTYLHRRVPLYALGEAKTGRFNYAIGTSQHVAGERIAVDGDQVLVRVAPQCHPDPDYRY